MITHLLQSLSIVTKKEGSQFLIDCPACGKPKHCHIDSTNGLWHCKVCQAKGNPFQLIKHHCPDKSPADIMAILKEHNLDTPSDTPRPASKSKDLSYLRDKLQKASPADIERLCNAKGLGCEALKSFGPLRHKVDPIMYLPAFTPNIKKACGFLRCHLDGELVELKDGRKEKYPVLGTHGLFRYADSDTILFCEAWRDALAAIAIGYAATASTGGASTWKDCWLPAFKGKTVYIIMDCDSAGNGGPLTGEDGKVRILKGAAVRAADRIVTVAKKTHIVRLPFPMVEKHGPDLLDYLEGGKG
jgi:hypothetical protein